MKALDLVTFLTDFGWDGGYVAACEATIIRVHSPARVLHVSHEIPVGDVPAGALVLARVAPLCPLAVHLAVVDPGVGTARRPLALGAARGDWLVGPDNGLLVDAAESLGGVTGAWSLHIEKARLLAGLPPEQVSPTFHGRDLFAPVSALLASGVDPPLLGDPVDVGSLTRLVPSGVQATDGGVSAPVIEIDRFGNVSLGLPFAHLSATWQTEIPGAAEAVGHRGGSGTPVVASEVAPEAGDLAAGDAATAGSGLGDAAHSSAPAVVEGVVRQGEARFRVGVTGEGQPERIARVVGTYGDLLPGELGLLGDSWGQAALALNGASAAESLGVRRGMRVTLVAATGVSKGAPAGPAEGSRGR